MEYELTYYDSAVHRFNHNTTRTLPLYKYSFSLHTIKCQNSSTLSSSVYHKYTVSIWTIDRTLFGATTPGQSAPGSDGNGVVVRFPQTSSITRTSLSDCLVSYLGHLLEGRSYPSAEKQPVYFTAPVDGAIVGSSHGKPSSNPGRSLFALHIAPILFVKAWIQLFYFQQLIIRHSGLFDLRMATGLGEGKLWI